MICVILLLIIVACLNIFIKIKYSHWIKKGVKGPTPVPLVGNFGRLMMQQQTLVQLGDTAYKQFPNEKVVGLYCGLAPVLLLRDPHIINQVMTKDFNNFVNRGLRVAEEGFSNNLLIAEDDTWRNIRQKMSSVFTSNKLKLMTPLIYKSVDKFINQIDVLSTGSEGNCNIKELADKYSSDLVCSCGFGLNLDFYSNKAMLFSDIGKFAITPPVYFRLWSAAEMIIPGIQKAFPVIDPAVKLRRFFLLLVKDIMRQRENMKERRHDFMEAIINSFSQDKSRVIETKGLTEIKLDVNFIASQAFVFYTTAFETSSMTLSLLLYELSLREDYQEIAYREVCSILDKYNEQLTYDSVWEMNYLQKLLNETLRIYPVVGFILRKAAKDYVLPKTDIQVKAGTLILVCSNGLHHDPKYFEDPDSFNPENCSPENLKKIPQGAFFPFGIGPRNCIGARFGKMHVMMAAAAILRKFKLSPCTDKKKKLTFDSISNTLTATDGVWINVSRRN